MPNMTIGAGQTVSGPISGGIYTVTAGGSAVGVTVNNAILAISAGGSAAGTVINAGIVQVFSSGLESGTIVNGGIDSPIGGSDFGLTVNSGGTFNLMGGIVSGATFNSGSTDTLSGGIVLAATVKTGADLVEFLSGTGLSNISVQPGGEIDFGTLPYNSGGSVTLTTSNDLLTVVEGSAVSSIQLAGNYAGATVTKSDDGVVSPFTRQDGTLLTFQNILPTGTTVTSALPGAQLVGTYARYYAQTTMGLLEGGGVVSAGIDAAGDVAVASTVDGFGHTLFASGTGQSVIAAGGGADTVTVSNGADLIATGVGKNSVYLATGSNTVYSEGTDSVFVGAGSDTAYISGKTVITAGNASLNVFLQPNAQLTLTTGTGSVQVQGGFGSGTFSGGTNGNNLLVAGTGATTLYAGGNGDVLLASGGSSTTMYGYSGNETMTGQFSQGLDTFNFDSANVFAVGGSGTNLFNIGGGTNSVVAGLGAGTFNFTNGNAGGSTFIAGFNTSLDQIHLAGYAPGEAANALATATVFGGSEILHLRDGTTLGFGGVTGLTSASFV